MAFPQLASNFQFTWQSFQLWGALGGVIDVLYKRLIHSKVP